MGSLSALPLVHGWQGHFTEGHLGEEGKAVVQPAC